MLKFLRAVLSHSPKAESLQSDPLPCWGIHQRMGHVEVAGWFERLPDGTALCTAPAVMPSVAIKVDNDGGWIDSQWYAAVQEKRVYAGLPEETFIVPMSGPGFYGFHKTTGDQVHKARALRRVTEKVELTGVGEPVPKKSKWDAFIEEREDIDPAEDVEAWAQIQLEELGFKSTDYEGTATEHLRGLLDLWDGLYREADKKGPLIIEVDGTGDLVSYTSAAADAQVWVDTLEDDVSFLSDIGKPSDTQILQTALGLLTGTPQDPSLDKVVGFLRIRADGHGDKAGRLLVTAALLLTEVERRRRLAEGGHADAWEVPPLPVVGSHMGRGLTKEEAESLRSLVDAKTRRMEGLGQQLVENQKELDSKTDSLLNALRCLAEIGTLLEPGFEADDPQEVVDLTRRKIDAFKKDATLYAARKLPIVSVEDARAELRLCASLLSMAGINLDENGIDGPATVAAGIQELCRNHAKAQRAAEEKLSLAATDPKLIESLKRQEEELNGIRQLFKAEEWGDLRTWGATLDAVRVSLKDFENQVHEAKKLRDRYNDLVVSKDKQNEEAIRLKNQTIRDQTAHIDDLDKRLNKFRLTFKLLAKWDVSKPIDDQLLIRRTLDADSARIEDMRILDEVLGLNGPVETRGIEDRVGVVRALQKELADCKANLQGSQQAIIETCAKYERQIADLEKQLQGQAAALTEADKLRQAMKRLAGLDIDKTYDDGLLMETALQKAGIIDN